MSLNPCARCGFPETAFNRVEGEGNDREEVDYCFVCADDLGMLDGDIDWINFAEDERIRRGKLGERGCLF